MQLQQQLLTTPQSTPSINKKNCNAHPLSNPNHPGRVHRHTDKLPSRINQSESVKCKNDTVSSPNSHKNVNKPHKVHPLSNPNHPGRLHRHTDKLPNGINQGESVGCGKPSNSHKNANKPHKVHPLSNPNHPGRVHRHTDKLPSPIMPITGNGSVEHSQIVICPGNGIPERIVCGMRLNPKHHNVHPLSNPNHPGRVHRHTDKLPSPITGSSGENTVCKRNEPKKIVCTMSLNQQPHRFYPLSNPIQVHKKSSNETICVFKEAVVSC